MKKYYNQTKSKKNYEISNIKNIQLTSIISNYLLNEKYMKVDVGYIYENCPFCSHKNHFQINKRLNLYSSFSGCCKGGSIIDFIMEVEGLNFQQAISKLGDDFNIPQSEKQFDTSKREREILTLLAEYEDQRILKEINRFFEFLTFMEYDEIFDKSISLVGSTSLLSYIYDLKAGGIYE
jgi:DNA primase